VPAQEGGKESNASKQLYYIMRISLRGSQSPAVEDPYVPVELPLAIYDMLYWKRRTISSIPEVSAASSGSLERNLEVLGAATGFPHVLVG